MSLNLICVSGKVINTNYKPSDNSILEIALTVRTGEKKKAEEKYPPSNVYNVTLWGKYADAMSSVVNTGDMVAVSGSLGVPYSYVKGSDNTPACSLKIVGNVKLDVLSSDNNATTESVAEEPVKEETSSKSKKSREISFD